MNWKLLLAAVVSIWLAGCGGSSDNSSGQNDDTQAIGRLLTSQSLDIPGEINASSVLQYDYSMPGVQGGSVTARSLYLTPPGDRPDGGYPLVVWAHGTTGIAESCSPSANFPNFYNTTAINALLDAGYAVAAPDYEGFGTERIHPYYIRSSHAESVLNAVAALHEIDSVAVTDEWAVVGHSQGGHVALATARAVQLPNYPLKAVAALAPGTDLELISDAQFQAFDDLTAVGEISLSGSRLYYLSTIINKRTAESSHVQGRLRAVRDDQSSSDVVELSENGSGLGSGCALARRCMCSKRKSASARWWGSLTALSGSL